MHCRSCSAAQFACWKSGTALRESWQLVWVAELRLPKISPASCTGFVGMYCIQLPFRITIQDKQGVDLMVLGSFI